MGGENAGQMKRPAEENGPADRHRQVRRTCLFLGLIVAAVFLAWLAGEAVQSHLISRRQRRWQEAICPVPQTMPVRTTGDPADIVRSPLAEVGLAPMEGDPGGFRPPAGARRLFAFERRLTDALEQQARYELSGTPPKAADHYTRAFVAGGFRRLADTVDAAGRRTLVFEKPPAHATLALRRNPRDEKSVIIVLTVVRSQPAGESGTR
jgi:hypothetical protein